ncbi:MAG TPA: hypothetical protein VGF86_12730 [Candidatus Tumulicola sp.]|jgi:photosystem II stability/assembly factor-like uncharacterized protein
MPFRRYLRGAVATCAVLATFAPAVGAYAGPDPLRNLKYRSIGPAIAGGRTTAFVGTDRDARLYYAGGADGGVFKSVDGGVSWNAVFDRASSASIGAIAISSRDLNDVWVGTGEANPRNDVESGDGIWHSTDGGKTWTHAGLDDAGQISSIAIDPNDPRVVVVGVLGQAFRDSRTRGAYLTRDAGAHWKRTLFTGPSSGVSDLVRVPDRPATLFAGMYQFRRQPWMMTSGGPHGGLYRSNDGGATWRKVTGGGFPGGLTGRIGLAAAKGGRIYAIVQSKLGDLWRSDDGGTSWKLMPHSPYVGARPFYFSTIAVDPVDRNRLIDVGLVLSMSDDAGRTFHPISENAGWDYHSVWWSGDGRRVAVGTDEGAILSASGGAHFWQPYDLPFAQAYHVGFDDDLPGYRVCIGLQDDSSWCGLSTAYNGIGVLNRDWQTIGPGDGMWALVDPTDPDLIWSTSTNSDTGQVFLWNRRTQQADEVSPVATYNSRAPASLRYRFNWDTPIAFTHETPPRVLVGGNVLFASADRGRHWTPISPDLTRDDKEHQRASGGPITLDVSGAETSDTILDVETSVLGRGLFWVGTDDGLVRLTRDAGAHWDDVTPAGVPPWGRVATVDPGHFAAGTAYVAIDRHLLGDDRPYAFATDDFGKTWRSISANLPSNRFLRSLREDVDDPNLLFAGTQRGVWVSFDRGLHWQSLRLNMPATAVYDLEIQPASGDLIVASHGRGVWILDDLRPLRGLTKAQSAGPATFFAPRAAYMMWEWSPVNVFSNGTLPANEFVGENPDYGALLSYYLTQPARRRPTLTIFDANGHAVRHLDGTGVPNAAGIDRTSWDLAEDGPEQWHGTFRENRGPAEGPNVVPGNYTVELRAGGQTLRQTLAVLPDPRDPAPLSDYLKRHDFLTELFAEFGGTNHMLNGIDAALKNANRTHAAALRGFRAELTYDARNVEDLREPPGIRERLVDLISRLSSSFQTPTAAQAAEGADLKALYQSASARYAEMMKP